MCAIYTIYFLISCDRGCFIGKSAVIKYYQFLSKVIVFRKLYFDLLATASSSTLLNTVDLWFLLFFLVFSFNFPSHRPWLKSYSHFIHWISYFVINHVDESLYQFTLLCIECLLTKLQFIQQYIYNWMHYIFTSKHPLQEKLNRWRLSTQCVKFKIDCMKWLISQAWGYNFWICHFICKKTNGIFFYLIITFKMSILRRLKASFVNTITLVVCNDIQIVKDARHGTFYLFSCKN